MSITPLLRRILISAAVSASVAAWASAEAERVVTTDGVVHVTPVPIDERFKNPTTPEYEKQLLEHANAAIAYHKGKGYGNLFFENEKNSYPVAMLDFLAGNRANALKTLQSDDSEGYNRYTNMVDFYPCFTLKGQVRKYFFFGPYLDAAYRQKMFEGAKVWTASDPKKRPMAGVEKKGGGWGPDGTGVCVDTRNTDNLRAMRDVATYLFAEETGNAEVAATYKQNIRVFVGTMYQRGHGEWDSNNYLGHTFSAYLGLYDFAKDPDVKLMGKAALDYMSASAALKYWRGDFGGPSKRDYGGKLAYGTNAASSFSYYFGDCPLPNPRPDRDDVHSITSAYRPPAAVLALALKQVKKPVEIFAAKPTYDISRAPADTKPETHETQYLANSYQLGSLIEGSSGDMNGFKLMTYNSKRGTDDFYAITGSDHSPKGISTEAGAAHNVAQYRNVALFLTASSKSPIQFFLPKSALISSENGVTFVRFEKTYLALVPINLNITGIDAAATEEVNFSVSKDKKKGTETKVPALPDDQLMLAVGTGGGMCGFAMEVGEDESHGSFEKFKAGVKPANVDVSKLEAGVVEYASPLGHKLKFERGSGGLPVVSRDGKVHDWVLHQQWWPADGSMSPIQLDWNGKGRLHVEAGGHTFDGTLSADGKYAFENK